MPGVIQLADVVKHVLQSVNLRVIAGLVSQPLNSAKNVLYLRTEHFSIMEMSLDPAFCLSLPGCWPLPHCSTL